MDHDNMDAAEKLGVEELTKFIETSLDIDCEKDNAEVLSGTETCKASDDFNGCGDSDEAANGFCPLDEEILNVSRNVEAPGEELLIPWSKDSRFIDDVLLKTYISRFCLKDDFLDFSQTKPKTNKSLEITENNFEPSGNSSFENGQPPTIILDQKDSKRLSSQKPNHLLQPSSKDCLMMDSTSMLGSLRNNLKDLLQKVDELLEAMDSRPHWNRLAGKSNSPWKLNNSQSDLDSGLSTDKKPKVLKQWTETKLKYSRLSASLNALLHPCRSSSQILELLAEVKNIVLECVDLNNEQESLNLPENILAVSETNSDARYMYNVERRIITIEVTLTNIKFEIDKFYEDYKKAFSIIDENI